ncbi:TerB family tellurite resistance protein, partial [Pseudomonadales bacterium]|nr:TerB family tellurite resistance protein [Pseudomonadales bacterium]
VDQSEMARIKSLIWSVDGLNQRQRVLLLAKAHYWSCIGVAHDEYDGHYVKAALSTDLAAQKIVALSTAARLKMLDVAKDIAISDGEIHVNEMNVVKKLYKALDIPIRHAKRDVESYAKLIHMDIRFEKNKLDEDDVALEEINDFLGDILKEYEVI